MSQQQIEFVVRACIIWPSIGSHYKARLKNRLDWKSKTCKKAITTTFSTPKKVSSDHKYSDTIQPFELQLKKTFQTSLRIIRLHVDRHLFASVWISMNLLTIGWKNISSAAKKRTKQQQLHCVHAEFRY